MERLVKAQKAAGRATAAAGRLKGFEIVMMRDGIEAVAVVAAMRGHAGSMEVQGRGRVLGAGSRDRRTCG